MANVSGFVSTSIIDKEGVPGSVQQFFEAVDTTTLAQAVSEAITLQDKQDAIIDGQIVGMELKINVPLDILTIKTAPTDSAEIERTILLNFSQTGIRYKFGIDIPSVALRIYDLGKSLFTDTALKAYIDYILAGDAHLKYVSKFLLALVAVLDAVLSFRKHRKPEIRSTFTEAPPGE